MPYLLGIASARGPALRGVSVYRGTSLIRNRLRIGPYSSLVPEGIGWSLGVGAIYCGPGITVGCSFLQHSKLIVDEAAVQVSTPWPCPSLWRFGLWVSFFSVP